MNSYNTDLSDEDVIRFLETLSNWGRWGEEDEAGTLNFITAESRTAAIAEVRRGLVVSCAMEIRPQPGSQVLHHMLETGGDPGAHSSLDFMGIAAHGESITHVDALCHIFARRKMYNGFSADQVSSKGANHNGISNAVGRMVGRGVLLDIPASKGLERLRPGTPIHPDDLEAAEAFGNVKVRSGDMLYVRTGRHVESPGRGEGDSAHALAGLHASCLPWLHSREVAVLGSDAISDVRPSGFRKMFLPVHVVAITAMGMTLIDNCHLEQLSRTTREFAQWSFLNVVSPLNFPGATGSAATPVALF